jgi:hypothetical protein
MAVTPATVNAVLVALRSDMVVLLLNAVGRRRESREKRVQHLDSESQTPRRAPASQVTGRPTGPRRWRIELGARRLPSHAPTAPEPLAVLVLPPQRCCRGLTA